MRKVFVFVESDKEYTQLVDTYMTKYNTVQGFVLREFTTTENIQSLFNLPDTRPFNKNYSSTVIEEESREVVFEYAPGTVFFVIMGKYEED